MGVAWPGNYKSLALLVMAVPLLWHRWLAGLGDVPASATFGGIFAALNYSTPRTIRTSKMIKGLEQLS